MTRTPLRTVGWKKWHPAMTTELDNAAFALPPKVAKLDAVRKLAVRLTEVTGLGETAALTVAEAVVDPTAVRAMLAEPLPGLTASKEAHLQVIPTRVWTPWLAAPADEMLRYGAQKRYPIADSTVPPIPSATETADGVAVQWPNQADRAWHLDDNERLYGKDVHRQSLRVFPEKGGIVHPLVLVPQSETFADGSDTLNSLRVEDGRYRYYGVMAMLRRYAGLPPEELAGHLGADITPEIFQAALERDRAALTKVINAVREACIKAGDGNDFHQLVGVHFMATTLSVPAYITVGTVEPNSGRAHPFGSASNGGHGAISALRLGMLRWHGGDGSAQLVRTGQQAHNGLQLPEARVDSELLAVVDKRLQVRQVPRSVIDFGYGKKGAKAAAQFVWWCRAVGQLDGTPATAVAGFAAATEGPWPEGISQSLLACASHLMEEDRGTVFPPGDYRENEARPDSLSLLVTDARDVPAVAGLSSDGKGNVLAHPRFHNAVHIALAHLALIGALPAEEPLPERITGHVHLLSHVALSWAYSQTALFVRAGGAGYQDAAGRVLPLDERTLSRDDLPWPKTHTPVNYLVPPSAPHPYEEATHVFRLRHGVVYTIPAGPLDESTIEATPEALAKAVRRWFPDATGIVLTDWSDKLITGVMVGSVFVRLFDRKAESEDARSRGVWYPEGRPPGTKDVLDFDTATSGAPVGTLLGAGDWLQETVGNGVGVDMVEADEAWYEEFDSDLISEVDEALEIQKAGGTESGDKPDFRRDVPVLRLPEIKVQR